MNLKYKFINPSSITYGELINNIKQICNNVEITYTKGILTLTYKNCNLSGESKLHFHIDDNFEKIEDIFNIELGWFTITDSNMVILKLFFDEFALTFYDENYIFETENLSKEYFIHTLREYAFECMMHHGIIHSLSEIEHKTGISPFFSQDIINKANKEKEKHTKILLFKIKLQLYYIKTKFWVKNKIKNILKK